LGFRLEKEGGRLVRNPIVLAPFAGAGAEPALETAIKQAKVLEAASHSDINNLRTGVTQ
jgi:hypothetical protein